MKVWDVVIIGGGHNGLACAAYLAKAGADVLVLEQEARSGGASVTDETWPGYKVSSAAYVASLMPQQIVDDLGFDETHEVVPQFWSNMVAKLQSTTMVCKSGVCFICLILFCLVVCGFNAL